AWLVWGWIESTRLERDLDELETRKERLDVADFETKPTTPGQKEASHLYAEAGRLVGERAIASADAARVSRLIEASCATRADSAARASTLRDLQAFEEPY